MVTIGTHHNGSFTAFTAAEFVTAFAAMVVGALVGAEGLLGYFFNYSFMFEGINHVAEIYGGLAVAIASAVAAVYLFLTR